MSPEKIDQVLSFLIALALTIAYTLVLALVDYIERG